MAKRKRDDDCAAASSSVRGRHQPSSSSNVPANKSTSDSKLDSSLLAAHLPKGINDPSRLDVKFACFYVLTEDLYDMLGTYCTIASQKILVQDHESFNDCLTVISHPVCAKICSSNSMEVDSSNSIKSLKETIMGEIRDLLLSACIRFPMICCRDGIIPKQCHTQVHEDPGVLAQASVEFPTASLSRILMKAGFEYVRIQVYDGKSLVLDPINWVDRFIVRFNERYQDAQLQLCCNQFDIRIAEPESVVPDRAITAAQSLVAIKSLKRPELRRSNRIQTKQRRAY